MGQRGSSAVSLTCYIGDLCVIFGDLEAGLRQRLAYLLRHHLEPQAEGGPHRSATIYYESGSFGLEKRGLLLEEQGGEVPIWRWGIPSAHPTWPSESLFYRLVKPALSRLFSGLGVARIHGALLHHPATGPLWLVGERGVGKSSAAASFLHQGCSLLTDDQILVHRPDGPAPCFGLYRELHIDPALRPRLPRFPSLATAEEYLPGTGRLRFDWLQDFPQHRLPPQPLPSHILLSRVDPEASTRIRRLTAEEAEDLAEICLASEEENRDLAPQVRRGFHRALAASRGWSVVWGADIWDFPGRHPEFLSQRLGTGGRPP